MGRNAIITGETNDCKIARGRIAISYFNYVTKFNSICMNLTLFTTKRNRVKLELENFTQKKHKTQITTWRCTDTRFRFEGTGKTIEGFFEFVSTNFQYHEANSAKKGAGTIRKKQGLTKLGKNKSFHTDFNQQLKSRSSGSYALSLNHMVRRFQF